MTTLWDALRWRWRWALLLPVAAWIIAQASLVYVGLASLALLGLPLLLRFPWLVLPAVAALLPFSSSFKLGPISGTEGLLAIALALWFADGVRRRELTLPPSLPAIAALSYGTFLYLLLFTASNFAEAIAEMLKWFEFAAVVLLVHSMMGSEERRWLVLGLLLGGVLQGLLGLYQFVFRIGPDWFLFLGRYMRAYGSFSQPNPYAGYLGLTLPVSVSLALYGVQRLRQLNFRQLISPSILESPMGWGIVGAFSAGVIALGLLLSWSRGGWLGALAGLTVVLFLRSKGTIAMGALAFLVVLALALLGSITPAFVPDVIASRLSDLPAYFGLTDILSQPLTDENFAVVERVAHWAAAIRMWQLSPWIGVGPGNYATLYDSVKIAGWDEALGHAHNIYLNVLAETGILGLLFYLVFWIVVTVWLIKQLLIAKRSNDGWQQALILGILGVSVHFSIHNIFDNLFVHGMYLHLALWIGTIASRSVGEKV